MSFLSNVGVLLPASLTGLYNISDHARLIAKHRTNRCCYLYCRIYTYGQKWNPWKQTGRFFFSWKNTHLYLPKMCINCSWKETILRGKMMLNGSQRLFNSLTAWTCFFMFHNNNLASKWLLWCESPLNQESYKMLKRFPSGRWPGRGQWDWKVCLPEGTWLPKVYRLQRGLLCGIWKTRRASYLTALGFI